MPKQQVRSKKQSLSSFVDPVMREAAALKNARPVANEEHEDKYRVSAVNLKESDWTLLRLAAEGRRVKTGKGRPSVSAVIESLINENRARLERERKEYIEHLAGKAR